MLTYRICILLTSFWLSSMVSLISSSRQLNEINVFRLWLFSWLFKLIVIFLMKIYLAYLETVSRNYWNQMHNIYCTLAFKLVSFFNLLYFCVPLFVFFFAVFVVFVICAGQMPLLSISTTHGLAQYQASPCVEVIPPSKS